MTRRYISCRECGETIELPTDPMDGEFIECGSCLSGYELMGPETYVRFLDRREEDPELQKLAILEQVTIAGTVYRPVETGEIDDFGE